MSGREPQCKACRGKRTAALNVARGRARKRDLVHRFGGCCGHCSGVFHPAAFDFHHLDPAQKDFGLSGGNLANKGLSTVLAESQKCVMLCSNCHRTLHASEYEMKAAQ